MGLAQLQFQTIKNGPKRLRPILAFCWALGFLALTSPAQAAFTGAYALNQFTLTNMNADGKAITPDGGLSIVLIDLLLAGDNALVIAMAVRSL